MAEEIASGYLSIGPALAKDFKAKLDAQLQPVAAQAGQLVGRRTAEAMPAGLASGGTALNRAGQQAGAAIARSAATAAGDGLATAAPGIVTRFKDRVAASVTSFARSGGFSSIASSVGEIATTALPQLRELQTSSGRVTGAINGTANAAGSVLPGALAIGAAAFGVWQTAQENARKAAEDFAATLDKNSGAATMQTYQLAAQRFVKEFSLEDLQTTPITLREITSALVRGGDELTRVQAKLQASRDAEIKAAGLNFVAANQAAEKYNRLGNAINNLANDNRNSITVWHEAKAATEAATGAAGEQEGAVRSLSVATTGLATAINSIPGGASVVISTNLATVINEARQALALLAALGAGAQYSAGAAINDYLAGIGSGKYEDPIAAAKKKADEAAAKARAAAERAAREASAAARRAARQAQSEADKAAREAAQAAQAARERIAADRKSLQDSISGVVSRARQTAFPDITSLPKSPPGILRALKKQLFVLRRFRVHLNLLARRGLPKVFLQQLIDAGLDGAETAAALARAKDSDFNDIKRTTKALNTESGKLATSSLSILYGTGQNAVRALVRGMDAEQRLVEQQMLKIAKGMKKAIEKALGIKSPSRVFREIGRNIASSIPLGVDDRRGLVDRSMAGLVRPPRAVRVPAAMYGAALPGPASLIEGGLHMHNPVEKTLNASTTDALRETAFLLGYTA
ncbi:MAG: hypothetical protein AB7I38_14465 [Dehalococcoidia bacterium]